MDRLIAIGLERRRAHKIREPIETLNQALARARLEVIEIVAHGAANIFNNYFNHIVSTDRLSGGEGRRDGLIA